MTKRLPDELTLPGGVANIAPEQWNDLVDRTGPFMDWRFLSALESEDSVGQPQGWEPCPLLIQGNDGPQAAAAAYLKSHSHGEFVFDWAWARAAHQVAINWYPKLLIASPFSPVPGPRLLGSKTHPDAARKLIQSAEALVEERMLSSAGVNFCRPEDAVLLREAGWLERFDWQYHWHNEDYGDFDEFLSRLKRKPRKNIRAERRRVRDAGWTFEWKDGTQLSEADLSRVDNCYQSTFALYGNLPMLNRGFFAQTAARFGKNFLVCEASQDGKPKAAAIFWRDDQRLYGRYWGSLEETRDVHFETCYYQGIDYCIEHGLQWFEPGAQGEHKIRRGFLPQKTQSFHYIRHLNLRHAIDRYLDQEARALLHYREQLETLNPFA
ncbi:MAG: GNAT family N-acetyltransferase [Pseudomonadota bacterium]